MSEVREWGREDAALLLRVPTADDDKYSRGVVGLRTGSAEYPGAAVLGVEAAWRAGAGFVRYVGPAASLVLARRPETVVDTDSTARVGAWVIGSGTDAATRSTDETAALRALLAGEAPLVVDAGALDLVRDATAPLVLTPHTGEFTRLRAALGLAAPGSDRAADARETAATLGHTIVWKGAETLVASPDGHALVVSAQTHWLSTAGTGDVLAGVIGAVIAAQPQAPLAEAAATGVWLHSRAGAIAAGVAAQHPGHPIVALDVAEAVPLAIADLFTNKEEK